ncbi:protein kinase [Martiniozyma asiatica (nom. inval.)]|nr:protein kinase [Martiniozyma asiatica]
MRLDTTYMRYLSPDDWRVLHATEKGSHTHEVVPTKLICQLSNLKQGNSTALKCISELAKLSLVSRLRNAKYDGYRITYNGFDFVALKSLHQHGNIEELDNTIGVGKESDIYAAKTKDGQQRVLKIHRLGRVSFRTVKNKRDYLRTGQGGSWMFLSKLAAQKEYEFMSILYHAGFDVPIPYDCSRHLVLMERIDGFPMRQLREHFNYKGLYSELMMFAVKLANSGLIHCDFNEYNIMIKEEGTYNRETEKGFVVIDFPQCISIEHPDAVYYFKRDINCIRRFFKRRFNYSPKNDTMMLDTDGYGEGYKYAYPIFTRDVKRENDLDVKVKASGYKKKLDARDRDVQNAFGSTAVELDNSEWNSDDEEDDSFDEASDNDGDDGDSDEYDSDIYSDSEDNEGDDLEEENEKIIEALSTGVGNLKMDKLGNYILEE